MQITAPLQLISCGHPLDTSPAAFGSLTASDAHGEPTETLRQRLQSDGYLYLKGFYPRDDILTGRQTIIEELDSRRLVDRRFPLEQAVIDREHYVPSEATIESLSFLGQRPPLRDLLYGNPLRSFLNGLLDGPTRSFDFTWLRAVAQKGANPHCDIVYMGRGTDQLFTTWTPWGDIDLELGGLMVLEGSHQKSDRIQKYLQRDVDTYCENRPPSRNAKGNRHGWSWSGSLSNNPASLREKLGGRWLTNAFQAGDLMLFGMSLVHSSLDNHTDRFRLSSDTRHQRAHLAADPRWIGENPPGHSTASKQGRIC